MIPAIESRNLTKKFASSANRDVLQKINLSILPGECFALLGPNGAGKTTLIKILCSLILPTSGEIRINGIDAVRNPEKVKKVIGYGMGEERSFYGRLTGRQNLEFFATLNGLGKKEMISKIKKAAALFEIKDLERRYQEYSTGMKHRLALARCFLNGASIIFMDEPTRSLDPAAASHLRLLMKDFVKEDSKRTLFFTTHLTHEAEELADRIGILDRGILKIHGALQEMRDQIGKPEASLEEIFMRSTG